MNIDINTLTADNITAEIMSQMTKEQVQAFKAKLTPEQMQKIAAKYGASKTECEDISPELEAELKEKIAKSAAPVTNTVAVEEQPQVETPTEQTGAIIFGRQQ